MKTMEELAIRRGLEAISHAIVEEEKLLDVLKHQPEDHKEWIARLEKMIPEHKDIYDEAKDPETTMASHLEGIEKVNREWTEGLCKEVHERIEQLKSGGAVLESINRILTEQKTFFDAIEEQPDVYKDWIVRLKKIMKDHKALYDILAAPGTSVGNREVGIKKINKEWGEGLRKEITDFTDKLKKEREEKE